MITGPLAADATNRTRGAIPRTGTAPRAFDRVLPTVTTLIETAAGSGEFAPQKLLRVSSIYQATGTRETVCDVYTRGLDSEELTGPGSLGGEHLKDLLQSLHPDRLVRVQRERGADEPEILFEGYPQSRAFQWNQERQGASAQCMSRGHHELRYGENQHVAGRIMRLRPFATFDPENSDLVTVEALPATFNPAGKPNRDPQSLPFGDTTNVSAFSDDDAPLAAEWTAAGALRHIAWFFVAGEEARATNEVSAADLFEDTKDLELLPPSVFASDPFNRRMLTRLNDVSIQGLSAFEAIAVVCDAVGLAFEVPVRMKEDGSGEPEHWLRIYAPPEELGDLSARKALKMIRPEARDIPRDPPFTDYAASTTAKTIAERNAAQQVSITMDERTINRPKFLGGKELYECDLLLRPGWFPQPFMDNVQPEDAADAWAIWLDRFSPGNIDPETGLPLSIYHGQHPDHAAAAEAFRRWIFPDTFEYIDQSAMTSPLGRDVGPWTDGLYSPFDEWPNFDRLVYANGAIGGGIAPAIVEHWALRRRPFRDTIGRLNQSTADRSPIISVNYHATDPATALADPNWVPWIGAATFDPVRAALTLTVDDIVNDPAMRVNPEDPGSLPALAAYLGLDFDEKTFVGCHFFLKVTCVVEGDRRLAFTSVQRSGRRLVTSKVIDLGTEQFRLDARRTQQSALNGQQTDPDPAYEERDDGIALLDYGNKAARAMTLPRVSGPIETPWIETSVRNGDVMTGCSGMGIAFAAPSQVIGIEYTFDDNAGHRTTLHTTDLRAAPEVGAEV